MVPGHPGGPGMVPGHPGGPGMVPGHPGGPGMAPGYPGGPGMVPGHPGGPGMAPGYPRGPGMAPMPGYHTGGPGMMPPGYPGPEMAPYGYPGVPPGHHHMGPGMVPRHSASPGVHRHRATPDKSNASPGHTHTASPVVAAPQVTIPDEAAGCTSSPGRGDLAQDGRSPIAKTTSAPPPEPGAEAQQGKMEEKDEAHESVSTDSSNAGEEKAPPRPGGEKVSPRPGEEKAPPRHGEKASPRHGEEKQRAERDKVAMERQAWYR